MSASQPIATWREAARAGRPSRALKLRAAIYGQIVWIVVIGALVRGALSQDAGHQLIPARAVNPAVELLVRLAELLFGLAAIAALWVLPAVVVVLAFWS